MDLASRLRPLQSALRSRLSRADVLAEVIREVNSTLDPERVADAIVTRDLAAAQRFTREVDSGTVTVNASTRFTDGAEFGFGAEIGISTQKLHARGPMGLRELTTLKYVVEGDGQIRG